MHESFFAECEYKFADADAAGRGEFVGYASTFGNVDQGGDIVERGAFARSLQAKKLADIPMFFNHDHRGIPIGKWTQLEEDDRGLMAKGSLTLDIPKARDVHAAMKEGTVRGMSIGFRMKAEDVAFERAGAVRRIKNLDLVEISVVTQPMNLRATVGRVKSIHDMTAQDFRDLEATLREKGLSRTDAVKAISGLKEYLQREAGEQAEETDRDDQTKALADLLRRNIKTLTQKD
jgi:uncharacterized protein